MSTWSKRWRNERQQLSTFNVSQVVMFATACVDHAEVRLREALQASRVKASVPLLTKAIDLLWLASTGKAGPLVDRVRAAARELEGLVPDDDSPDIAVFGWANLLNATIYALACAEGRDLEVHAFSAADYAYQSVFEQQIFPKLDREMIEDEVETLERADPLCMQEIDFQLSCMRKIASGQLIERAKRD
jgi:hypothetical protein